MSGTRAISSDREAVRPALLRGAMAARSRALGDCARGSAGGAAEKAAAEAAPVTATASTLRNIAIEDSVDRRSLLRRRMSRVTEPAAGVGYIYFNTHLFTSQNLFLRFQSSRNKPCHFSHLFRIAVFLMQTIVSLSLRSGRPPVPEPPLCPLCHNFHLPMTCAESYDKSSAGSGHWYHSSHASPLLRANATILRLPFELCTSSSPRSSKRDLSAT